MKDFFLLLRQIFLKTLFIWYDLKVVLVNVLQDGKDYFSSGKPSPFIAVFIFNHKTPTITAQQFYKQALILIFLVTESSLRAEIWS